MDRKELLQQLADDIITRRQSEPLLVGIDGVDGAGKTTLANDLKIELGKRDIPVGRASIEGFHNPREVRVKKGSLSPEGYYQDSFDYQFLIENLLQPAKSAAVEVTLPSKKFDFRTNSSVEGQTVTITPSTVLLFEGVFLFRSLLEKFWGFKIFLDIDEATSLSRGIERDSELLGGVEQTRSKYEHRYIPGQRLYKTEINPRAKADIVVNNNNPDFPEISS